MGNILQRLLQQVAQAAVFLCTAKTSFFNLIMVFILIMVLVKNFYKKIKSYLFK